MSIKWKNILLALPVMLSLVAVITAVMTVVNLAPSQSFMAVWPRSFLFALLVLLPFGGLVFVTVNTMVNRYLSNWPLTKRNLTHGVVTAIVMESVMAVITTINTHNYASSIQFLDEYFTSLFSALPIGLAFACIMSLFVKPRIEKHLSSATA